MDLQRVISQLRGELELLDVAIANLERLASRNAERPSQERPVPAEKKATKSHSAGGSAA